MLSVSLVQACTFSRIIKCPPWDTSHVSVERCGRSCCHYYSHCVRESKLVIFNKNALTLSKIRKSFAFSHLRRFIFKKIKKAKKLDFLVFSFSPFRQLTPELTPTPFLLAPFCSEKLEKHRISYRNPVFLWLRRQDSNLRPPGYEWRYSELFYIKTTRLTASNYK